MVPSISGNRSLFLRAKLEAFSATKAQINGVGEPEKDGAPIKHRGGPDLSCKPL